jgi:uncharacterized protein YvpB
MRRRILALLGCLGIIVLSLITPTATAAPESDNSHTSGAAFKSWQGAKLYLGTTEGAANVTPHGVTLTRNGQHGAWTSPVVKPNKPLDAINPSWMADTPAGTFINVTLRVRETSGAWSGWYQMGLWTFGPTPKRTSTNDQGDDYGVIYTDTYVRADKAVSAYQLRVELNANGAAKPTVRAVAGQASQFVEFTQVSPTTMRRTTDLDVPQYSQYVLQGAYPAYGGGGEAWCSPTSTEMVVEYFGRGPTDADVQALPPDPVLDTVNPIYGPYGKVAYAAIHTYDEAYEGTGNWPFNTAYAAHYGLNSAVRVFSSLQDVEKEIRQGRPVVVSIKWDNTDANPANDLPGAGIPKTDGHLMVVRGFEADGDVIANDPAVRINLTDSDPSNDSVRRVYSRFPFERQWTVASGRTAYTFAR